MKKYTQLELLNEGFWNGIKSAGRGLDYILKKAAPEVRKLYRDPYNAVKGLKNAIKGSNAQKTSTSVSSDVLMSIKKGLQRRNMIVSNQTPIRRVAIDPNSGKDIYTVTVIDTSSPSRAQRQIYVDKNGSQITN